MTQAVQGRNGGGLDDSVMGNSTSLDWILGGFEGCVYRISGQIGCGWEKEVEAISKDLNLRNRSNGVSFTEMGVG